MIIGIPREIKNHEYRVGMTPAGVELLVRAGHEVLIEKGAGVGSGFEDAQYTALGARLLDTPAEVFGRAEMIIKVKEPLDPEFPLLREGQVLFTYLHLAGSETLTKRLLPTKCVGIAYETMVDRNGRLPLLVPMSEVAGRLAIQEGAKYLERSFGGRGLLLGGVPGTEPAHIVIIGAGVVGRNAAQVAIGMGAQTTVMDTNLDVLRQLDLHFGGRLRTLKATPWNIRETITNADVVVGAVLHAGAKAPWVVTRDMLSTMKKGAVLVDVSIDQGGCFETSRPTTHSDPIFEVDGVVHYCVANMPGSVPRTSTVALTNATMNYAVDIATKGWVRACREDDTVKSGLNVCRGKLTCRPVAETFNLPLTPYEEVLK
jgi:alanine dehydrogenase